MQPASGLAAVSEHPEKLLSVGFSSKDRKHSFMWTSRAVLSRLQPHLQGMLELPLAMARSRFNHDFRAERNTDFKKMLVEQN